MITKGKSKAKPQTAVGMLARGPGVAVFGRPGKEWSEIGESYAAGLVAQLDRLWSMHFDGTIEAPLTEAELELVECVRSGGVETLRARARECLALVDAYEPELRVGQVTAPAPGGLRPAAPTTGSLSGKTRKKTARAKQAERRPVWGPVEVIPLDRCVMHPDNSPHSDEDIAARAVSLERTGQLEAIKVWLLPDEPQERYLVLGGWGRVLAARKAKWTEIEARPLRGIQIDGQMGLPEDQDLLGLLAEDNSQRRTLSVLDKAALGRKLEEAGWSCDEAARRVGFQSASSLSNAKRLLDLPDKLRQLVTLPDDDPKKLKQATLRRLADYGHVPAIVDAVLEDLENCPDEWRQYPDDSLNHVLRKATRPVDSQSQRMLGHIYAPPPAAAELPAVTIPVYDREGEKTAVLVTTATKEWDEARNKWDKQTVSGDRDDDRKPAAADKRVLTPEEKRREARQKVEQLDKRRRRWEYQWRLQFVRRELEAEPASSGSDRAFGRLTCWAVTEPGQERRKHLAANVEAAGYAKGLTRRYSSSVECLKPLASESQLRDVLDRQLLAILADTETSNPDFPHVPFELIGQLCQDLAFCPATEWLGLYGSPEGRKTLASLWMTHEREQLAAIAAKVPNCEPISDKKGDLVRALVESHCECPDWLVGKKPAAKKGKR